MLFHPVHTFSWLLYANDCMSEILHSFLYLNQMLNFCQKFGFFVNISKLSKVAGKNSLMVNFYRNFTPTAFIVPLWIIDAISSCLGYSWWHHTWNRYVRIIDRYIFLLSMNFLVLTTHAFDGMNCINPFQIFITRVHISKLKKWQNLNLS